MKGDPFFLSGNIKVDLGEREKKKTLEGLEFVILKLGGHCRGLGNSQHNKGVFTRTITITPKN